MKELTPKQKSVLRFIKVYIRDNHRPPTVREIAAEFQVTVKRAYDHLEALERKEKIIKQKGFRNIVVIQDKTFVIWLTKKMLNAPDKKTKDMYQLVRQKYFELL